MRLYLELGAAAAYLLWVLYNQLKVRTVRHRQRIYLILIALGLLVIAEHFGSLKWSGMLVLALVVGDLILPIGFGWLRAQSYKIWVNEQSVVVRRGNWLTLLLWLIYIILRFVVGSLAKGTESWVVASLGLSLLLQREVVWRKAQKRFPDEMARDEKDEVE